MGYTASMTNISTSPPVLSIVGRSNSGKTTLLVKLIGELTDQGLRIGSIKHSHHQPEMDSPGKDSWRHKQAGAIGSMLVGPERLMMVTDVDVGGLNAQSAPEQSVSKQSVPEKLAARYFSDFDLVLVEGYAGMQGAKIEVVRGERSHKLRNAEDKGLIAVVTDVSALDCSGLESSLPRFDLEDVFSLSVFVRDWMKQHD